MLWKLSTNKLRKFNFLIFQRKPRKAPHPQTPSNVGHAGRPTPLARLCGSSNTRWITVAALFKVVTVHRRLRRRKTPIRRMRSPWRRSTRTRSWTRCPAFRRPSTKEAEEDWRALRRFKGPVRTLEVRSSWKQALARHLKDGQKLPTKTRRIYRRNRRRNLWTRTPIRSILVSTSLGFIYLFGIRWIMRRTGCF